ncbi:MAG: metalloregulator ArsR/SmtB family transcription factor [Coriobacteriia bacterium]|nr:metalloregulator ArsR/SmtB family transcription factor [Coriobacteriia bacterium]
MGTTEILKALSDDNRMRIVQMLAAGERCVCELACELQESDALVSHHLKQLREAGLVRTRRVGRWLHCSLEFAALESLASTLVDLASAARAAESSASCACGAYPHPTEEIWP